MPLWSVKQWEAISKIRSGKRLNGHLKQMGRSNTLHRVPLLGVNDTIMTEVRRQRVSAPQFLEDFVS